jgi:hypothetical protein
MNLHALKNRENTEKYPALMKLQLKYDKLLQELSKKDLPQDLVIIINTEIDLLNSSFIRNKVFIKDIKKSYNTILKILQKEQKIVPKNYYRNIWLAIGMSSFGIPLGIAFGLALDNMAFLGIGLPIGMAIGIAVGINFDKKAKAENRQLDIEVG